MARELNLDSDPLRQFQLWYNEAKKAGLHLPEAMTLATATSEGRPSARMVLYKGLSEGGFRIFTNFESRKARDLIDNPFAALVFHWGPHERQIRVEGRI